MGEIVKHEKKTFFDKIKEKFTSFFSQMVDEVDDTEEIKKLEESRLKKKETLRETTKKESYDYIRRLKVLLSITKGTKFEEKIQSILDTTTKVHVYVYEKDLSPNVLRGFHLHYTESFLKLYEKILTEKKSIEEAKLVKEATYVQEKVEDVEDMPEIDTYHQSYDDWVKSGKPIKELNQYYDEKGKVQIVGKDDYFKELSANYITYICSYYGMNEDSIQYLGDSKMDNFPIIYNLATKKVAKIHLVTGDLIEIEQE